MTEDIRKIYDEYFNNIDDNDTWNDDTVRAAISLYAKIERCGLNPPDFGDYVARLADEAMFRGFAEGFRLGQRQKNIGI